MGKRKKISQQKSKNKKLPEVAIDPESKLSTRSVPAKSEYQQLANIATEFLDCYFLIGFNPDGYEVRCIKFSTPKEMNSLINITYKLIDEIESGTAEPPESSEESGPTNLE